MEGLPFSRPFSTSQIFWFLPSKISFEKQNSLQEKKSAAGVKIILIAENVKSVAYLKLMFISIQDLGKGKRLMGKLKRFYAVFEHLNGSD